MADDWKWASNWLKPVDWVDPSQPKGLVEQPQKRFQTYRFKGFVHIVNPLLRTTESY